MLTLALIEDHIPEQLQWQKTVEDWSLLNSTPIILHIYSCAHDFWQARELWQDLTVIFLDIDLPDRNGIELARQLRSEKVKAEFIFLTAHREYVFEGYGVSALDYLMKPLSPHALDQCMQRILRKYESGIYTWRTGSDIIRIPFRDILYFSSYRHNTEIITEQQTFSQRLHLRDVLRVLPAQFVQIHRTTIINLHHVYCLSGNTVIMQNQDKLSVSRAYLPNLKKELIREAF